MWRRLRQPVRGGIEHHLHLSRHRLKRGHHPRYVPVHQVRGHGASGDKHMPRPGSHQSQQKLAAPGSPPAASCLTPGPCRRHSWSAICRNIHCAHRRGIRQTAVQPSRYSQALTRSAPWTPHQRTCCPHRIIPRVAAISRMAAWPRPGALPREHPPSLARCSLPPPGAGIAHPLGPAARKPGSPGAFRHRGSSKTTASGPGGWPRSLSLNAD